MRRVLKTSLTALLLSGVAAMPLATAFTVASVDAAFAKSDKSKGGGGGGGKGGGKKSSKGGKDKKASTKSRSGKSGGGKSAKRNGGDPVGSFFNKLRGKDKKAQRATKAPKKVAKVAPAAKVAKAAKGSGMHPSELGNMNGAMNANINAVLAHVRNGNTNGPVGAMAMLAVAKANADGAGDIVESQTGQEYDALISAVEANESYATVEEYMAAKEAGGADFVEDEAIEAALGNLGTGAVDDAIANNETYASVEEYQTAKDAGGDDFVVDEGLEAAIAAQGAYDAATADEVSGAVAALASLEDAEQNLLDTWNKNPGEVEVAEGETTPQEDLIQKAHDRLEGYGDQINAAIETSETHDDDEMDGDGDMEADGDCEDADTCTDEEVAAVVE